jgi:peptidyl-prolyl cis-trans isomerase SurA
MGMKNIFALLFAAASIASAQTLDRVVAVVGDEWILESELNAQTQFYALANRIDPATPGLREQLLQNMISEKLILAKAIEDSVTVTEDEVTQQLDAVLQQRIAQAGSESKLEEAYGMPLSRIRREFRDDMKKNLLTQKLQQQRFGNSQIGRIEVEEFYKTYKDSLGEVPEEVELGHIYVRPKFDDAAKQAARKKLSALIDSLKAGVAFNELAQRHSQDPGSASSGGDLGFVRRGLFVKEFESAVFGLKENEMSGIVETDFGVHVIQLMERRGDAVRARHILLRIERTQVSDDTTIAFLKSLRGQILAGADFAELATRYSEDKETQSIGGNLGVLELQQLPKDLQAVVTPMKAGEISEPSKLTFGSQYGYSIVWLKRRIPAHKATLEQDYKRIETVASNYKRQKEYAAWLDELKKKIYWESRL